jgi:hypothetical protein
MARDGYDELKKIPYLHAVPPAGLIRLRVNRGEDGEKG